MNLSLVLVAALVLGGAPDPGTSKPTAPAEKPSRLQLAKDGWKMATARYQAGSVPIEEVVRWSQWLFDAERAVSGEAARDQHLSRLIELEREVDRRVQAGLATQLDLLAVRYLLATAQFPAK